MKRRLALAGLILAAQSGAWAEGTCHPAVDPSQPQFVVGYGSLMQEASKRRTTPQAGPSRPVWVSGFERGWYARGSAFSPTTYLGAVVRPDGRMNGVVYALPGVSEIEATDAREQGYCRKPVAAAQLAPLDLDPLPSGQVWIYALEAGQANPPDAAFPIVQSYVDIFVGGCHEIGQAHALADFAEACVSTTTGWSSHWVNDRLMPRRPFIHEPKARVIDATLAKMVPEYLKARVIE